MPGIILKCIRHFRMCLCTVPWWKEGLFSMTLRWILCLEYYFSFCCFWSSFVCCILSICCCMAVSLCLIFLWVFWLEDESCEVGLGCMSVACINRGRMVSSRSGLYAAVLCFVFLSKKERNVLEQFHCYLFRIFKFT